jgi:hypothetical protein
LAGTAGANNAVSDDDLDSNFVSSFDDEENPSYIEFCLTHYFKKYRAQNIKGLCLSSLLIT